MQIFSVIWDLYIASVGYVFVVLCMICLVILSDECYVNGVKDTIKALPVIITLLVVISILWMICLLVLCYAYYLFISDEEEEGNITPVVPK